MPDSPEFREEEVREYLSTRGLTPAQVERILNDYRIAYYTPGRPDQIRVQQDLQAWMDDQIRAYTASSTTRSAAFVDTARDVDQRRDENSRAFTAVQDMAREAAARRRQVLQDNFYKGARIDHGPVMDPDVVANTLATGAWTDANGNYVDENGQPTTEPVPADANSIWHAIKGQRFNMGALSMPGVPAAIVPGQPLGDRRVSPSYYPHGTAYRGAAVAHPSADTMARTGRRDRTPIRAGAEPVRPRQFVTPSQALSLLSTMSEDYLIQLQHQMFEAGLYPEDSRPRWGHADTATRAAFRQLFVEASLDPDKNIAAVLADLAIDRRDMTAAPGGSPGAGAASMPDLVLPDFEPEVANEEEMRQSIDEIASETIGAFLPQDQREALIGRLREREVGLQRQQYDRDVQRVREQYGADVARASATGGEGGASFGDVDAFLAALSGQESGGDYGALNRGSGASGKYQIMPANWPSWARRAGLPPNAPRTPENQEIVARQIVMDYYEQYGNWRDVAVAWYSGPANIATKRYSDRAQRGGPSINDYADSVMSRMGGVRRGGMGGQAGGATLGGREFAPIEAFDPLAEAKAAIRAANPAAYTANEWGSRAAEFFGALGSVLGGA